jgi:hypothetical protein
MSYQIRISLPSTSCLIICLLFSGCPKQTNQGTQQIGQVLQAEGAATVSQTPPSTVFPPLQPGQQPLAVSGSKGIPGPAQVIELRGWLAEVEPGCNGTDPDWHYGLAIDPTWTDQQSIDLTTLILAGNLNVFSDQRDPNTPSSVVVGRPVVHVELNGWRPSVNHNGQTLPVDWGFTGADAVNCPGVSWAFNPTNPLSWQPPLAVGQYVRIVGSLLTDVPHESEAQIPTWLLATFGINSETSADKQKMVALNVLQQDWAGGRSDDDLNNPARWTEIHPPDIIAILDSPSSPQLPTETFRGVTVIATNCAFGCSQTLDTDITPPTAKPGSTGTINVKEIVNPATNATTIVDGVVNGKLLNCPANSIALNATGACVTINPGSVHIHVKVQQAGVSQVPGKFMALYRVSTQ